MSPDYKATYLLRCTSSGRRGTCLAIWPHPAAPRAERCFPQAAGPLEGVAPSTICPWGQAGPLLETSAPGSLVKAPAYPLPVCTQQSTSLWTPHPAPQTLLHEACCANGSWPPNQGPGWALNTPIILATEKWGFTCPGGGQGPVSFQGPCRCLLLMAVLLISDASPAELVPTFCQKAPPPGRGQAGRQAGPPLLGAQQWREPGSQASPGWGWAGPEDEGHFLLPLRKAHTGWGDTPLGSWQPGKLMWLTL